MLFTRKYLAILWNRHWPLLVIVLTSTLLLIWVSPKFVRMHDEGMLASTAMSIARGQVLYRDAFEFWTPLSVYLVAGSFSLFGYSVATLRILAAIILILNTVCFYFLLHRINSEKLFKIVGCTIFIAVTHSFAEMNHHWLGMLFLLLTINCISILIEIRSAMWAFVGGVTASLAFLSMQLEGVVASSLCLIVLLAWFRPINKLHIKIWGWLALGLSGPILLTAGYFYSQGAIDELIYSTIIFPLTQYRSVNGALAGLSLIAQIILVIAVSRFWLKHLTSISAKVWFVAVLLMLGCAAFTSNSTVANRYAFFPLTILWGYLLWAILKHSSTIKAIQIMASTSSPVRVSWLFLVAILLICGYASTVSRATAAWINIAKANSAISSPAGVMYARQDVAVKAQAIVDYVGINVRPEEQVYFGPFAAHYQFLTHKFSPIKYSQLTPEYNPEWMFTDAVRQLEEKKVGTIVLLPQENPFRFDRDNQLVQFLVKNYQPVKPLPFTTLLTSETLFIDVYERQQNNVPHDAIWQLKDQ